MTNGPPTPYWQEAIRSKVFGLCQRGPCSHGSLSRGCGKIVIWGGVQNGTRRIDDDLPVRRAPGLHCGHCITALRAHTWNQQWQSGRNGAHALNLSGISGAHHQPKLAIQVPRALSQFGDVLVQQR